METDVRETRVSDERNGRPAPGPISLTAYRKEHTSPLEIVPASRWRDWMNATDSRFANRCLPLLMANESGWWILNRDLVTAVWDGGPSRKALTVTYGEQVEADVSAASLFQSDVHVSSNFGYGILTWEIPYIFRTEPGYNLLARGPANLPKDGASPLEGLVETDWAVAPFTMNWKLTRPGMPVHFESGEPICMIVPQQRGELEAVVPRTSELAGDPYLLAGYEQFHRERCSNKLFQALADAGHPGVGDARTAWEMHYFRGQTPSGDPAHAHATKRRLRDFEGGRGGNSHPTDPVAPANGRGRASRSP